MVEFLNESIVQLKCKEKLTIRSTHILRLILMKTVKEHSEVDRQLTQSLREY
jgi:hypothetical protein